VHRIALRMRIVPPKATALAAQERLSGVVPPGATYATHMRLIAHGREVCRARRPRCEACVLLDLCPAGRAATWGRAGKI
jgi:endonuclease-3